MDVIAWIATGLVAWIALGLAAARFCSINRLSEENDNRTIDEAVQELREDMRAW
jgi:hypothetical protein